MPLISRWSSSRVETLALSPTTVRKDSAKDAEGVELPKIRLLTDSSEEVERLEKPCCIFKRPTIKQVG